jgi:hypothetical protein
MPRSGRLQRHVHVVALGQELVKPEREHRPLRVRVTHRRAGLQHRLDRRPARSSVLAARGRELRGGAGQRQRAAAPGPQLRRPVRLLQAQGGLHPRRQRIVDELAVFRVPPRPGGQGPHPAGQVTGPAGGRSSHPLQRLVDHVLRRHGHPEQPGRHLPHRLPLLGVAALAGHGRRRSHTLHIRCLASLPDPAGKQRHIRALPAPVGMQLVEHQKPQPPRGLDQLAPLLGTG